MREKGKQSLPALGLLPYGPFMAGHAQSIPPSLITPPPDEEKRPYDAASRSRLGTLGHAVFNTLYWPYLIGSCIAYFVPAVVLWVVLTPFDRQRRLLAAYTQLWGSHYLGWAPFAGLSFTGREHLESVSHGIYVSNHLSMVDVLAIYGVPGRFLWISKLENFLVPFLGWNMWLNRYVPLKRGYLPSIVRMYRTCLRRLDEGESLFIFPEGTRSDDGHLRAFYGGAFRMAVRAGVPIVPIVLEGSDRVLPKHSFRISPQLVRLKALEPVHPDEVGGDWRKLLDEVRRRMRHAQEELRSRLPGELSPDSKATADRAAA